ncbi:cupin domain-containing protein [Leifsonia poae]|uniref:Cupin n=1 Tax=Leifsonia poae TaxID=110933 RepID=A0A9W6H7H3_9MICO|nr:cupin domain-containing protein [Leifsonia poae]GLJ75365.1 cupin [Leifsonia poae]
MIESTNSQSADHYTWGEVSDGWRLVDEPGLSVIEERVPPGAGEEWHLHQTAAQFFYLLEGSARMNTRDGAVDLEPRNGVQVPPGIPHQLVYPGTADARFLVISAPNTRGDRRAASDGTTP